MRPVHRLFLLRLATLLALGTSAALLVDYTSSSPAFCSGNSGCGAVRYSGFGYIPLPYLGYLPVPVLGLLAFSALFSLSLSRSPQVQARWLAPLAYLVGLGSLGFLAIQAFVLKLFCVYCVVVDGLGVLSAILAFLLRGMGFQLAAEEELRQDAIVDVPLVHAEGRAVKKVWHEDSHIYEAPSPVLRPAPRGTLRLRRGAWLLTASIVLGAPLLFPKLVQLDPTPPSVRALYAPGKLNVVEFFDYQCPHCRELGPRLHELLKPWGPRLAFRRAYVPLPQHKGAKHAARVAICAEEQGLGEPVHLALLGATDFHLEALRSLAEQGAPGLSAEKLEQCLSSERPEKRLAQDLAAIQQAGFEGLPTTYVGSVRVLGSMPDDTFAETLEYVAQGKDIEGLRAWQYWVIVVALLGLVFVFGRVKPEPMVLRTET